MRAEVDAALPGSAVRTRRGTPGLDLRAGLYHQRPALGVARIGGDPRCTMEDRRAVQPSPRRPHRPAGRDHLAGPGMSPDLPARPGRRDGRARHLRPANRVARRCATAGTRRDRSSRGPARRGPGADRGGRRGRRAGRGRCACWPSPRRSRPPTWRCCWTSGSPRSGRTACRRPRAKVAEVRRGSPGRGAALARRRRAAAQQGPCRRSRWADRVESVDSVRLADALDAAVRRAEDAGGRAGPLPVLLQSASTATRTAAGYRQPGSLRARRTRRRVRRTAPGRADGRRPAGGRSGRGLRRRSPRPRPGCAPLIRRPATLSAGMSGDLEAAIRHGSDVVRVGTALVGERPITSPMIAGRWGRPVVRGSGSEGARMGAMYRLKAYFGMVPAEELDDYADETVGRPLRRRRGRDRAGPIRRASATATTLRRRSDDVRRPSRDEPTVREPTVPGRCRPRPVEPVRSVAGAARGRPGGPARSASGRRTRAPRGALAIDPETVRARGPAAEPVARPAARAAGAGGGRRRWPASPRCSRAATTRPARSASATATAQPVIMNLTELDDADAKRLVDFAAGLAFALRGSIDKVTNRVFLLTPADVEVSADDARRLAERSVAPTRDRRASRPRPVPRPVRTCRMATCPRHPVRHLLRAVLLLAAAHRADRGRARPQLRPPVGARRTERGRRWRSIFTATDPPVKLLRRVIPVVRIGGVGLDLSIMVLLLVVFILMNVAQPIAGVSPSHPVPPPRTA